MPIERRQILLSSEELAHALDAYRRVNTTFLPQGDVLKVAVGPGADKHIPGGVELTASIRMRYGGSEHEADFMIGGTELLELLIRFCLENNIPVPREGAKFAALIDGAVALRIEYGH
jgi:hypothetical protein